MKKITFLLTMLIASMGYLQAVDLPIDFEGGPYAFIDFDGGTATVITNPQSSGINTSTTVAQIVRDGGATWAGSKLILGSKLDFSTTNAITMKVYSPRADMPILFKLEGDANTEISVNTTVANEWETLTWDFAGTSSDTYNTLVFMFDFGAVGDGSANSTFLFDDVELIDNTGGLSQIDLPVDFESATVNYDLSDFGDNATVLGADPSNGANNVAITTKTTGSETWAGTTIGTALGFATVIPITETDTRISVDVYSPTASIPIRLKAEDHNDPTKSVETETLTTMANAWETLVFDFSNEATGTAALNLAFNFDMVSIFFNFGTVGSDKVYYWDNVVFVTGAAASDDATLSDLMVDGTTVTGFDAATTAYIVELAAGTATVPAVTATATDATNATVDITAAAAIPGTTSVLVTAEDGTTTETYTVEFTLAVSIGSFDLESIHVYAHEGMLYVNSDDQLINGSIEVFDISGRKLFNATITNSREQYILSTTGVYIIKITDSTSQKVLVEKVVSR